MGRAKKCKSSDVTMWSRKTMQHKSHRLDAALPFRLAKDAESQAVQWNQDMLLARYGIKRITRR